MRCLLCYEVFQPAERGAGGECPRCQSGTHIAPSSYDVCLQTSWEELRLLLFWSEQWVTQIQGDRTLLSAIRARFEAHRPKQPAVVNKPCRFVAISRSGQIVPLRDSDEPE